MKKLTLKLFLISFLAASQIVSAATAVFNVTVPVGTNACYIIGSFNAWDQTKSVKLTKVDVTHYTVTLNDSAFAAGVTLANMQYKYCSGPGDWAYVEKDALGADVLNRTFTVSPKADVVARWALTWANLPVLPMHITIKVSTPKGTKECYIVGTFNNWAGPTAPADSCKMSFISMNPDSSVIFQKTIYTSDANKLNYHFCSGPDWSYEQLAPIGDYHYPDANVIVNSWKAVYNPGLTGTIKIRATVPAGTQQVWIVGNFISWDITKAVEGLKNPDGTYSFIIPKVMDIQYRLYNQPDWNYSEVGQADPTVDLANRTASYPADSISNITVWGWKQGTLDNTAPTVPGTLQSSSVTTTSFHLSWIASTDNVGVADYEVYKDSVFYGSTSTLGMDITGLMAGKSYTMTVKAKDASGNYSASSLPLIVNTLSNPKIEHSFNVTVPSGTYQCWLVGNFNGWNIKQNQMMKVDSTHYTITLNDSTFAAGITWANLEYKYCSGGGDWAFVEKDSLGREITNRVYTDGIDVVRSWYFTYNPNIPPLPMHVTIDVTTPGGTKECYIVGTFNNWAGPTAPADSCKMVLKSINPDGTVTFEKTIYTSDANRLMYHFCSGPDWLYVQSSPTGDYKYPNVTPVVTAWKAIYNPFVSTNLLTNPGFEEWTGGVPTGWTLTTTVGAIVSSSITPTGNALQVAGPTGTFLVSQNVVPPSGASTFDVNKTYRISLKYLVTAGDGSDARIWSGMLTNAVGGTTVYYVPTTHADSLSYYIPLHGPGGNVVLPIGMTGNDYNGYLLDNRATGIWHTYSCDIKFPQGITQFQFMVRSYKASTVIWDDMFFGESDGGSPLDNTPPTAPKALQSSLPTTNSFHLSWNASIDNVGVTGYDVYKDSVYYGSTSTPDMDINGLMAGRSYTMNVRAKDAAGNFSVFSLPLMVTTLANIQSKVTFNVTVPVGTNQCWLVGNYNGWNNNLNQMTKVDNTHYTITLNDSTFAAGVTSANLTYKYLSGGGDWAYVEKDSIGAEVPNRVYTDGIDVVKSWASIYIPHIVQPMNVTIKVLTPVGTKECYIVGNFNKWAGPTAPADSCKMIKLSETQDGVIFEKTIYTADAFLLAYHFCSGPDWLYEQSSPIGDFRYPEVLPIVTAWKAVYDPTMTGTIKIRATVPAGTQQVWIQGGFLGWDMTKAIEGVKNADGTFSFVVPNVMDIQYKLYNKPDWNYFEVGQADPTIEIPNRTASYPTDSITNITVWGWKQTLQVVSDITVRTGDEFVLPVSVLTNLSLPNAINSYQFELNYNAQKIKYLGFSSNNTISNSGLVMVNSNQPGKLIIGYAATQYLVGSGVLLNLNFKAVEAGVGSPKIDKFIFNTDSTTNVVVPNVSVIQTYGDIDQNSYVQAYDAALALQYSIGLNPIPNIEPLPWSAWRIATADVDNSGSVTANDAGLILQYAVKLITTFPAAIKVNSYKAPAANNSDVSIVREGNNLIFRSYGNLIGLNVSVTENFSALGTPVFNNQSMMHATNISSDQFLIGLATANSPANAEVIMTIPIKDTFKGAIVFNMIINTTPKESIVSVASGTNNPYDQAVVVYPNPAKDKVWVKIANEAASVVRVYNSLGQMVYNSTIDNKQLMQIDTRSWYKEGIYQLQIVDANKTVIHNQKLIIK